MSGFSESAHPRQPAGSGNGGEFASKSGFPADDVVRDGNINDRQTTLAVIDGKPPLDEETASAMYDYVRNDYRGMNAALRKHPRWMDKLLDGTDINNLDPQNRKMSLIQSVLKEQLDKPMIVYRGTSLPPKAVAKLDTPGAKLKLAGFQSTSMSPAVASGFGGEYMLEIKIKQGRFLDQSAEQEFLLPHGAKFKVIGRKTVKMRVNPGRLYEDSKQPIREVEVIQLEQEMIR